jgi:hypothetical protein
MIEIEEEKYQECYIFLITDFFQRNVKKALFGEQKSVNTLMLINGLSQSKN